MFRIIIIFSAAWLMFSVGASAQNISEYRYWWDDDITTLVTTSVGAGPVLDLNTVFSTSALDNGHHTLTVQVKDDNDVWSVPYTKIFYQNGDLIQYEYWFDDDINSSTVQSTPPSDWQQVTASIDASSLSPGLHKITLRALTNNGESSVPYTRYFKQSGGAIANWEYWFDDDVSNIIQEQVSPPVSMLDLIENLDVTGLSEGSHTVTWRCEDEQSNWSVPITYAFDVLVGIDEIAGLESVLIYPSPARDQLSIRVEANTALQLDVEIVNQNGQVLSSYRNGLSSESGFLTLDVSNLSAGAYFVRLSSDKKFVTHRFVKQ